MVIFTFLLWGHPLHTYSSGTMRSGHLPIEGALIHLVRRRKCWGRLGESAGLFDRVNLRLGGSLDMVVAKESVLM